jgi:hypothetical protein
VPRYVLILYHATQAGHKENLHSNYRVIR